MFLLVSLHKKECRLKIKQYIGCDFTSFKLCALNKTTEIMESLQAVHLEESCVKKKKKKNGHAVYK